MDIGCVFSDGLCQQRIDKPDNGRIVFAFEQILGFRQCVREPREIKFIVNIFDHLPRLGSVARIDSAQQLVEFLISDVLEDKSAASESPKLGHRRQIGFRSARYGQSSVNI